MRYVTSTLAAMTLASAVGVLAQEQQPPAQAPPGEQAAPTQQAASKEQAAPKFTLGCVGGEDHRRRWYVLSKAEGGKATMARACRTIRTDFSQNVNKKIKSSGRVKEPERRH
jgi:hypothetical protein